MRSANDVKVERIYKKLDDLKTMDAVQLKEMWHRYFDHVPPQYQRDFMLRRIAYHLQAKAFGGLSTKARNKLKRLAEGQDQIREKYRISVGTRLIREYKGKRLHVTVRQNGFEYDGQMYETLTAVAEEITGSVTSGPAFFGIRPRRNVNG